MKSNNHIYLNGRYTDSKGNYHLCNAHLAYKDRSVIIDYEWCLHHYSSIEEKKANNVVPFEVYPCRNDIAVGYAKLSTYNKVDLSDLISKLDNIIEEEIKAHEAE